MSLCTHARNIERKNKFFKVLFRIKKGNFNYVDPDPHYRRLFPEFAWSTQINRTKIAENFNIYLKIH